MSLELQIKSEGIVEIKKLYKNKRIEQIENCDIEYYHTNDEEYYI